MTTVYLVQSFIKPFCHFVIFIVQIHGMVSVGGHAFEAEEKSGTKGYYVGFAFPKIYEIAASAYRIALLFYALYKRPYRLIIKVYIGKRCK